MRISDWSSDVCSSDLPRAVATLARGSSDNAATFARYLIETRVGVLTSSAAPSIASVYAAAPDRSEEHTSELQSLMRISYAVFCLKKKQTTTQHTRTTKTTAEARTYEATSSTKQ